MGENIIAPGPAHKGKPVDEPEAVGNRVNAPKGPADADRPVDAPGRPGPADPGKPVDEPEAADQPVDKQKLFDQPEGFDRTPTAPIPAEGDSTAPKPTEFEAPVEPAAKLPVGRHAEPDESPSRAATLFDEGATTGFRDRWRELQADFVDDPARAVRNADGLIDEIMRELAKRKDGLEERWRDGPGDTEELRVAMTEYRSFFNQLLNA